MSGVVMWVAVTSSLLVTSVSPLVTTLASLSRSSCDLECFCSEDAASCPDSGLDNIPHDLDPLLTRLDLAGNNIKYISTMYYSRLEHLDFSRNQINQIKTDSFSDNHDLVVLNISHNKLGSLSKDDLHGLSSLATLGLADNELDTLGSDVFGFCGQLRTLDLSGNKIYHLEGDTFRGVRGSLRELSLAHNLLGAVPRVALQGLGHLALLDLSENQISILQNRDFEGISPGLMELRMSGCGLHSISDSAFYGVGSLKTLDLSNNGLSVAPNRAFGYVKHLEELSIGRNKLRTLHSGDFLFLERLKHFDLDGCSVDSLTLEPGIFRQNTNMETIKIRCPGLTTVSEEVSFKHMPALQSLSFHGSGLETVPRNLAKYQDLATLDLGSNPLRCDCNLEFLYKLLTAPVPVEVLGSCSQPLSLQDTQLIKVPPSDFSCAEDAAAGTSPWVYAGLAPAILLFFVVAGFLLHRYWRTKPWNISILLHSRDSNQPKKRLSRTFSGDKRDIVVVQRDADIAADDERFLPLRGLQYADPQYVNCDLNSNKSTSASEHLYSEVAEVKETIPKYNIPIPNVKCPDVKVSMI